MTFGVISFPFIVFFFSFFLESLCGYSLPVMLCVHQFLAGADLKCLFNRVARLGQKPQESGTL